MIKKFIHYPEKTIFAIYYVKHKVMYYNLNFSGATKIYIMM
jgi:hypothetical protein